MKRKEDHGKLVDYERSKIQLQALMELKSKMADQLLDLQRQLQEARKVRIVLRQTVDVKITRKWHIGFLKERTKASFAKAIPKSSFQV